MDRLGTENGNGDSKGQTGDSPLREVQKKKSRILVVRGW